MKPKNNIVFCYGCHRSKMLFETKSKADNFIKFNKGNIIKEKGYAPVRSYYCEFCCGYHVTSNSSVEVGERLDVKEHNFLMQFSYSDLDNIEFQEYYNRALNEINQAESAMFAGDFSKIESLHIKNEELRTKNKVLLRLPLKNRVKFLLLTQKIESLYEQSLKVQELMEGGEEARKEFLSCEHPTQKHLSVTSILKGLEFMEKIEEKIEEIQNQIDNGDIDTALEMKKELRHSVANAEDVRKMAKTACNRIINGIEAKIAQKRREIMAATPVEEKHFPDDASQEQYNDNSTIIETINILEEIKKCYDEGDIDACETKLEVAELIFSGIAIKDTKADVIQSYIDNWKKILIQAAENHDTDK